MAMSRTVIQYYSCTYNYIYHFNEYIWLLYTVLINSYGQLNYVLDTSECVRH